MGTINIDGVELDFSKIKEDRYNIPEKSLTKLKEYLLPEEKIELSLRGGWGTESRGSRNAGKVSGGLPPRGKAMWGHPWFILTNKRILFFAKGVVTSDLRDFSYKNITSVDYENGFLSDRLTIHAIGSVEDLLFYKDVISVSRKLPAIIRTRIEKHGKEDKTVSSGEDPFHILKTRFAKGEISKEEFAQMKKDLQEM